MELSDRLQTWKEASPILPREESIRETIALSKEAYFCQESQRLLSYPEFLWNQFHVTRKRWWILQGCLLLLASQILPTMEPDFRRVRSIGVIGCLFVIFLIPELWRNRESGATQVEAACFYDLRQIYSARIVLFGLGDVVLLTLFGHSLSRLGLSPLDVLAQFLLPATVTACICFSLLCTKRNWGEAASMTASLSWCSLWWLIIMNEKLYLSIAPSVWLSLFGLSLTGLILAVLKTVRTTNQYWEVDCFGTTTG